MDAGDGGEDEILKALTNSNLSKRRRRTYRSQRETEGQRRPCGFAERTSATLEARSTRFNRKKRVECNDRAFFEDTRGLRIIGPNTRPDIGHSANTSITCVPTLVCARRDVYFPTHTLDIKLKVDLEVDVHQSMRNANAMVCQWRPFVYWYPVSHIRTDRDCHFRLFVSSACFCIRVLYFQIRKEFVAFIRQGTCVRMWRKLCKRNRPACLRTNLIQVAASIDVAMPFGSI